MPADDPVVDKNELLASVGNGGPPAVVEAAADVLRKPVGQWVTRVKYDADKGFREEDLSTPAAEYAQRFLIPQGVGAETREVSVPGIAGTFIAKEIEGQILEYNVEGKRWKPLRVNSVAELKQFHESQPGKTKRFLEQFGFDTFGVDPITGTGAADQLIGQDFIPIMAGPFYKQLYIYDYLKMHATAFQQVNHSALAAAAIKIMMRFVLGRGISFHIKHPAAAAVWEEFTTRVKYRDKLRQMARDLPWQGELMIRFYDREQGYTSIRVLDPSTCWEKLTDPEDIERVYYYHFQWATPYQTWVTGKIPSSKYIIQQIPPTNILHITINISSQEKRGRSDLLPAMPWIKRFNDFYDGQTVKAVLEANLVYKIKIKGDQDDIDAFLTNPALTELPPPGGTWIENEAVDLQATSATLTAGRGSSGIGQQLASIVAASLNLPSEYFNVETAGPARATALVRTDPAVKTIEDRQQMMREINEEIYEHVMANAYSAGRLPKEAAREEPATGPDEFETQGMGDEERDRTVVTARALRGVTR